MIRLTPVFAIWCYGVTVLNDRLVAGLAGLEPAHLPWPHFLQFKRA